MANSITKTSELLVSFMNFSDRLPISATTLSTENASVCSNCMNACCLDDSQWPRNNNNNFMQDVRVSTPPITDRKTSVVMDADRNMTGAKDNDGVEERRTKIIMMREQRLNNRSSTAESSCPDKTWLNRPLNVEKHYNNYIPQHRSYEKVSNVQRKQMSHTSTQQEDCNNIVIVKPYYVKNAVQREPKS